MKKKLYFFYSLVFFLLLLSLPINFYASPKDEAAREKFDYLELSFVGDIMAHDVNYRMKDYNLIYDEVRHLLQGDDLSFGNVEMPVCDELPLSSFPKFNVHSDYLKAAIDSGFDVFSFANNHTNDQEVKGINGTIASIRAFQKEKTLYYSGVKESDAEDLKPVLIEKKGWTILFLSITELLNSYDSSRRRVYYSSPTAKGRKILLDKIRKMRKENPCDLFILSLHLSEAEYGLEVLQAKKNWFKTLAENGVDIVWAHHPHVVQNWEVAEIHSIEDESRDNSKKGNLKKAFFMYSMGNFISGQRWKVNYNDPNYYREYTGDSVLMQVRVKKTRKKGYFKFTIKPVLITNYNSKAGPIVKLFTPEFIKGLNKKGKEYFKARFDLMHKYLPLR